MEKRMENDMETGGFEEGNLSYYIGGNLFFFFFFFFFFFYPLW